MQQRPCPHFEWPQGEPCPPENDPIVAQYWVLQSGRIIHGEKVPSLFGADGKPLGPLALETAPGIRWWHDGDRGFLSDEYGALLNKAFASGERNVSRGGYNWVLKEDGTGTQTFAGVTSRVVQLIPG